MMIEIVAVVGAVLVAALLVFLIYQASRTYDAGAHATFITTKDGDFYGALRSPMTIWDPRIKVLRERRAPEITIMTVDASGNYYEKSLVNRRTGEISLRVHTCAPRPFVTRTSDKRSLVIKAKVSFQLDIDRIQIPTQMEAFGATLGSRIENLFDNAIGELEDQDVFARQREIEARVLARARDDRDPRRGRAARRHAHGHQDLRGHVLLRAARKGAQQGPVQRPDGLRQRAPRRHRRHAREGQSADRRGPDAHAGAADPAEHRADAVQVGRPGRLHRLRTRPLRAHGRPRPQWRQHHEARRPVRARSRQRRGRRPTAPVAAPIDPAAAYYGLGAPKGVQPPKGN